MKYGTHTIKITGDYLNTVNRKFTVSSSKNKKSYKKKKINNFNYERKFKLRKNT